MMDFDNLVEMQERSCREHGDREMYGARKDGAFQWMTFTGFASRVDELRGGLAGLGVGPGDKVAIIANNCLEWPVAAYATYGRRAHFVPMYETQSIEDWEYILRDSGARVLMVRTKELLEKLKDFPERIDTLEHLVLLQGEDPSCPTFESLRAEGRKNPVPSEKPAREEPFGLIYTSGTTGKPKGVILTHGNLMAELDSVCDLLDFHPEDRSLSFLPWGHLMGQIEEVHFLILKGFSSALVDDVQKIIEDFAEIRPTIFFTVPKLFQRLYNAVNEKITQKGGLIRFLFERGGELSSARRRGGRLGMKDRVVLSLARRLVFGRINAVFGGRLRMSMCGGEALNPEVIGFMEDLGVIVFEGYGLTETTMAVSANSREGRRHGSVGRALSGVRIVLDKNVEGAGEGEGEIVVYGPHIAAGYHNQPEVFQECLTEDGGFRTGDLGRFDKEGYLYITGRVKELYKLANGKYVAPAPLEEEVRQSPYIGFAMIHGDGQPYNVMLIVPEPTATAGLDPDTDLEKLMAAEVERFGGNFKTYEKPKRIAVLNDEWTTENGMLTPTLKIKRTVVTKKYMPLIEKLYQK